MDLTREFAEFVKADREEEEALAQQFRERNPDIRGMIGRLGATLTYDPVRDHLYVIVGKPRESIAILTTDDSVVVLADPETLEFLGTEVMDFSMVANRWAPLDQLLTSPHEIYLPPIQETTEIAQVVERELVLA